MVWCSLIFCSDSPENGIFLEKKIEKKKKMMKNFWLKMTYELSRRALLLLICKSQKRFGRITRKWQSNVCSRPFFHHSCFFPSFLKRDCERHEGEHILRQNYDMDSAKNIKLENHKTTWNMSMLMIFSTLSA